MANGNGRNLSDKKVDFWLWIPILFDVVRRWRKVFGIQKYISSFDLCYFIKRCPRKSYLNIDTWRHVNFIIPTYRFNIQWRIDIWQELGSAQSLRKSRKMVRQAGVIVILITAVVMGSGKIQVRLSW